jgi:hypothetical protein
MSEEVKTTAEPSSVQQKLAKRIQEKKEQKKQEKKAKKQAKKAAKRNHAPSVSEEAAVTKYNE